MCPAQQGQLHLSMLVEEVVHEKGKVDTGEWGVGSGRQSLGEGMKARRAFIPTTERSGPRIPGPHCVHKFTHSRPTIC